jgi:hypothetical protein
VIDDSQPATGGCDGALLQESTVGRG